MDTVTIWFMDNGTRLESREYGEDLVSIRKRAQELAEEYSRPIEAYEVIPLGTQYPESQMETCEKCGYRWPFAEEGIACPKCGHDNLPF